MAPIAAPVTPPTAAPTGPPTIAPVAAPPTAPLTVDDRANAAPDAKINAATAPIDCLISIFSSLKRRPDGPLLKPTRQNPPGSTCQTSVGDETRLRSDRRLRWTDGELVMEWQRAKVI